VIDFFSSERHFSDHLAPIWNELDESERGTFFAIRAGAEQCHHLGIPFRTSEPSPDELMLVASYQDLVAARLSSERFRRDPNRIVFLEHGAGQRYLGDPQVPAHESYSGGPDRNAVLLFLCPNEEVARANAEAYPKSRTEVIGAPKLDALLGLRPNLTGEICISFHADLHLCPETEWAYRHYRDVLSNLANRFKLIGHGHPRMWSLLEGEYRAMGVEPVKEFSEVLERASLYCVDNSSSLYEFAATGRPVLALNAPWYRRDVHHGLRFWDRIPGLQCDGPAELPEAIERALEDPTEIALNRFRVTKQVYGSLDGKASFRAAEAIRALG
jgi:hypothetical protein